MKKIDSAPQVIPPVYSSNKSNISAKKETLSDSSRISNTAKVYSKLDSFMNLGKSDRLNISDLNDSEKKEFFKMLSDLIRKGIVGYEVFDINDQPEKHYLVSQIGDERIYGAKLYKKKRIGE